MINEMRAQRILELPLDYIPNDEFSKAGCRKGRFSAPMPAPDEAVEEGPAAQRAAAVPGQPVRGAAADARAGSSTCSASSTT